MFDLHCHLLPGIDDGPATLEQSILLAKKSVECGITHVVCTPHIHFGVYDNTKSDIQSSVEFLKMNLKAERIPLNIAAAAEIRLCAQLPLLLKSGEVPLYGNVDGRSVVLLEFPSNSIPYGSIQLVDWMLANGYLPMIAHPERNLAFIDDVALLKPFLDRNCLIQVTAGSVEGKFGVKPKRLVDKLILEDRVDVMASDAHNLQYRPPCMLDAVDEVTRVKGSIYAMKLVFDNPLKITESMF